MRGRTHDRSLQSDMCQKREQEVWHEVGSGGFKEKVTVELHIY